MKIFDSFTHAMEWMLDNSSGPVSVRYYRGSVAYSFETATYTLAWRNGAFNTY